MVTVLGRQISMTCGESVNDSKVQWKVQLFGDSEERFIFNGYRIFQEYSEFHAVDDGRFGLSTAEAAIRHVGTYYCTRITGHHTTTYSAKLTVLESEPICGTNASKADGSVVEYDYLELWCNLRYFGELLPRLEWHRGDETNLTANSTNSNNPRELYSVVTQQMTAADNDVNYTVTIFFENQASRTSYDNVFEASNTPKYKLMVPINVLFGPRNVSIAPRKMTYSAGDILHCSAAGNPAPEFEWTEIGSSFYVDGPQLKVTENMVLKVERTYRCTAVNKLAGQRKTASETVVIGVEDTALDNYSRRLDTSVYVGIGASATGIILTAIIAVMCRLSKCNASNARTEEERSSSHVYEYASPDDAYPPPTSSTQQREIRTSASQDIINLTTTSNKEDIDACTYYEQEYDTISGRPSIEPVQVYASIQTAYENASYPED